MGRTGAWISRDERQVRDDARPHSSATGLISLDRSRSWIPPHRLFVNSLVLFALFQLVGEPTEGRDPQESCSRPSREAGSSAARPCRAESSVPNSTREFGTDFR